MDRNGAEDTDGERTSRMPGFYKLSLDRRLQRLEEAGVLNDDDLGFLRMQPGRFEADSTIENAVGTVEIPLGVATNFRVNGSDYLVPMAIEEPSVVAAASHAAKLVRSAGGFDSEMLGSTMTGQIQLVDAPSFSDAASAIIDHRQQLLEKANSIHQKLQQLGGGASDLGVEFLDGGETGGDQMLIVYLSVDPRDAMGANIVNSMLEHIAPDIEKLTGATAEMCILSNLADRRRIKTTCRIGFDKLGRSSDCEGSELAEKIASASDFAVRDAHRAVTHNKGIMNGIDAVCVATGNDWRAVEAGAHGFAASDGGYRPLSTWEIENGALVGELEMPIQVGTVGGTMHARRSVQIAQKLLGVTGADELSAVLGAVGLAQNLAALRALTTKGIQSGHMKLQARAVAAAAGATPDELDAVAARLVDSGSIDESEAERILDDLRAE